MSQYAPRFSARLKRQRLCQAAIRDRKEALMDSRRRGEEHQEQLERGEILPPSILLKPSSHTTGFIQAFFEALDGRTR